MFAQRPCSGCHIDQLYSRQPHGGLPLFTLALRSAICRLNGWQSREDAPDNDSDHAISSFYLSHYIWQPKPILISSTLPNNFNAPLRSLRPARAQQYFFYHEKPLTGFHQPRHKEASLLTIWEKLRKFHRFSLKLPLFLT